jgi:hypothetical protein
MREKTLYVSKNRRFEVIFMRNTLVLGVTYDKPDNELIVLLGVFFVRISF